MKGLPEGEKRGEGADGLSAELVGRIVVVGSGFGRRVLGVIHAGGLEGRCDYAEPGLDGAKWLAEAGVDGHTEHDLVSGRQFQATGVEL